MLSSEEAGMSETVSALKECRCVRGGECAGRDGAGRRQVINTYICRLIAALPPLSTINYPCTFLLAPTFSREGFDICYGLLICVP